MIKLTKLLDFVLKINVDARENLGEDSWCYAIGPENGMIAAFDGCGGSGARKHEYYSGHSEAYMASRLASGALYDAFSDTVGAEKGQTSPERILDCFRQYCRDSFAAHRPPAEQASKLKSMMISTLPTTLAALFFAPEKKGSTAVSAAWAGDSRVYVLTPSGLSQISLDDSDDNDPFDTDGMMTNTLNADRELRINVSNCEITLPAVLLTATDGCFAYYMTPMEFEGVLLSTLLAATSANEWEQLLSEQIGKVAGDDYTLVMASLGFGSFDALKQAFYLRYETLYNEYLVKLEALEPTDRDGRRNLWEKYKAEYIKYIKG